MSLMVDPASSLNKASLSLAFFAGPSYSAFRRWMVREFKGKRWHQSLKGKRYTLMREDEESLNKAIEDDWTIDAFIAGESALGKRNGRLMTSSLLQPSKVGGLLC